MKAVFCGPFFEFVMALVASRCRKYDALLSTNSFLSLFFGIIVERNSFQGYTVAVPCVFAIPLDVWAAHWCGYPSDPMHLTGKQSIENFARKWIHPVEPIDTQHTQHLQDSYRLKISGTGHKQGGGVKGRKMRGMHNLELQLPWGCFPMH